MFIISIHITITILHHELLYYILHYEVHPDSARWLYWLGKTCDKAGRADKAWEHLKYVHIMYMYNMI